NRSLLQAACGMNAGEPASNNDDMRPLGHCDSVALVASCLQHTSVMQTVCDIPLAGYSSTCKRRSAFQPPCSHGNHEHQRDEQNAVGCRSAEGERAKLRENLN